MYGALDGLALLISAAVGAHAEGFYFYYISPVLAEAFNKMANVCVLLHFRL
jgi:hypothetical protein